MSASLEEPYKVATGAAGWARMAWLPSGITSFADDFSKARTALMPAGSPPPPPPPQVLCRVYNKRLPGVCVCAVF